MIEVYICEDNVKRLNALVEYVNKYLLIHNADMMLARATTEPNLLLKNISNKHRRIYLLDISLNSQINGIELASKIREHDMNSKIIFVTTHVELAMTTFRYHLEVLDFILKDNPEEMQLRINQVLQLAEERINQDIHISPEYIRVKSGELERALRIKDILFIESSATPHKLTVHLFNSQVSYYGTIKDAEDLAPNFFRCHKSFVVNKDHIQSINKKTRELHLTDGETIMCSISAARILSKT
ncbi:LytR/AlgR family response regulator transcription factor [Lactiplantibacillus pentosus]|uniref:LytR/AlgR family response regulator transcription factor n=1 Tax=Lactiplantibacillus pentosus TaxID=1589 RepID=UPI001CD7BE57|nr:LytTR family DNA-binding domain-containing protein [Lactiplantibacillus pentosus]MCA1342923.1 response regulator transcription factor [Lactiplantibacillus pentosus]MCJ8185608.1 LytTR family DNA-binding domain-containing protein [Lactiplantibacillus pentosus]